MVKRIYLNDLLQLTDDELNKTKIRFTQPSPNRNPMSEYHSNPDAINKRALFWRTEQRYFNVGQIAIGLLKMSYDTWLLTTIKDVTKELGVKREINYEGEEIERYKQYFGRVIVRYHKKHQTQGVYAKNTIDKLEVAQILPTTYDGDEFPGYDKVKLTFKELETIISRNLPGWYEALENQKAVYLITDLANGKLYVGSAYGKKGLLKRWSDYIDNGHGGNKDLIEIVNAKKFDYVKENFQFSILENYNARVNDEVIKDREKWWKDVLASRKFGYNGN